MKTELPCAVVRDLLPNYIEGLTEEETAAAVRAHLEACESCRDRWETMRFGGEKTAEADLKEVDYLKTVRKKNRKKMLLAVTLAVVLVLGGICAKLFLIGTPADSGSAAFEVTPVPEYDSITVSIANMDSATVLVDLETQMEGDVIDITARKVLFSPVHLPEEASVSLNLSGVREVRALGETIWREGLVIDGFTHRLLDRKTPYIGDAPAVGQLVIALDLDAPRTMELQTAREPYGLMLHFRESIAENRRFMLEDSACLLLALVDNLGVVSWDDPSGYAGTLTLAEADAALPELTEQYNREHGTVWEAKSSVKDYAEDAYALQMLRELLKF